MPIGVIRGRGSKPTDWKSIVASRRSAPIVIMDFGQPLRGFPKLSLRAPMI